MDRLWAPWRIKYIQGKKEKGCIFCKSLNSKKKKNHIVFKEKHSFCILNLYPYNNGHIMVSPNRHVSELHQLNETELLDLFKSVNTAKQLLETTLKPQGYNIGINISKTAGAGIIGHLHIHIVPRWQGDANFITVMHNTRVISQSLDELQVKLKTKYEKTKKYQSPGR